jgi:hypothetical protein
MTILENRSQLSIARYTNELIELGIVIVAVVGHP